ncbi:MAG: hypothetical protein HZA91_01225 [Verrucomicrobia bacterium]|nr:hypothetical protein [Verrucomicrobiota bacterium]
MNDTALSALSAGAMLIGAVIGIAIGVLICWLLFDCCKRIPAQFRKQEPGMVWLLLIPLFNIVWVFFVFPRLSDSLKAYFDSVGKTGVGDCGRQIGFIYAICAVCGMIPFVNCLAGPAALVLLIIYLVKITGLKGQLPPAA